MAYDILSVGMRRMADPFGNGGAESFLELIDTENTYAGFAGQAAIVNPAETGLIWGTVVAAGGWTDTGGLVHTTDPADDVQVGPRFALDALVSGGTANVLTIGQNTTANHQARIDLIGDTTFSTYGLRLLRLAAGPDSESRLFHRGTGALNISAREAGEIWLGTTSLVRLTVTAAGLIGIGTSTPTNLLHVSTEAVGLGATLSSHTATATSGGSLRLHRSRGTAAAPTAILSGDRIGDEQYAGYTGSAYTVNASHEVIASQNWSPAARGSRQEWRVTAFNGINNTLGMTLADSGDLTIHRGSVFAIGASNFYSIDSVSTAGVSTTTDGRLYDRGLRFRQTAGDQISAGTVTYRHFGTQNALDLVGAGTLITARTVTIWDSIELPQGNAFPTTPVATRGVLYCDFAVAPEIVRWIDSAGTRNIVTPVWGRANAPNGMLLDLALSPAWTVVTGCSVTLPRAGTYRVGFCARGLQQAPGAFVKFRIFDVTGGAPVALSETLCILSSASNNFEASCHNELHLTVTAATTVRLEGSTNSATNGKARDTTDGRTAIWFARI